MVIQKYFKGEIWLVTIFHFLILYIILYNYFGQKALLFLNFFVVLLYGVFTKFSAIHKRKLIFAIIFVFILNTNLFIKSKDDESLNYDHKSNKEILFTLRKESNCKHRYLVIQTSPYCKNLIGDQISLKKISKSVRNMRFIQIIGVYNYELDELIFYNNTIKRISEKNFFRTFMGKLIKVDGKETSAEKFGYTILTGDKSILDSSLSKLMVDTGTIHLFAISGLHIGFFYLIVRSMLRFVVPTKPVLVVISLSISFFYVSLVDFNESATRALIMISFFEFSKLVAYRFSVVNSLVLAGIIMILINPVVLFELSFQLSFSVVLFIIFVMKSSSFIKNSCNYFSRVFWGNLLLSFSASAGCALLVLDKFNFFSFSSIPANLLVCPLTILFFTINFIHYSSSFIFNFSLFSSLHDIVFFAVEGVICFFSYYIPSYRSFNYLDFHNSLHLISFFSLSIILCLDFTWRLRFLIVFIYYSLIYCYCLFQIL